MRREGLGRWLLRWAPGLSLKHVHFAEETMAKHNFNPDRLRPPDVMQLMYMFGFNPTATAMGAPHAVPLPRGSACLTCVYVRCSSEQQWIIPSTAP